MVFIVTFSYKCIDYIHIHTCQSLFIAHFHADLYGCHSSTFDFYIKVSEPCLSLLYSSVEHCNQMLGNSPFI